MVYILIAYLNYSKKKMECNYIDENLSTNVNRLFIIIDRSYRIKRIVFLLKKENRNFYIYAGIDKTASTGILTLLLTL